MIANAALPRDLSPWGMFLNADIVVKVVMVGLVFASLVTWTVWLAKNLELWKATRNGRAALAVLNEARSLAEANARLGASSETVARLLRTAVHEVQTSPHPDPKALKERISWLLERVEASAEPPHRPRHGSARHHRRDRAVRRPVRHRLGHHEQLHRHLQRAHHQSRGGRAGHRRGAAGDRARPVRRHSRGRDLQRVLALDRRLSRAARRRLGAGDAAAEPRLRARVVAACRAPRRSSAVAIRLGHDGDDFAETHEINVTPFIDVILVLLIIFMIAAPLATVDVPVDLPATTAQRQERPDKPVFLTIKADRTLAIGDDPVPREALAATLETASHGNHDERIFLRADRAVTYGDVMEVMNTLRSAGYPQGRPGRTGGAGGQMTAQALILRARDGGEEIRRWSLAAAIVCAAHFGLMAGYLLMPKPEPEGAAVSPAVIVELAPLPVAPASPDDLAPGPDMVEAQPTPKPPEQTEPEVVEPMPKIEAPAEVTLPEPKPKAVEKKPEETPDTQKSETTAGPAEHAGAANDGGAALRTEHRGGACGAEPRQRCEPRRHRELARPRDGAAAAEQALSGRRRGAARAGRGRR